MFTDTAGFPSPDFSGGETIVVCKTILFSMEIFVLNKYMDYMCWIEKQDRLPWSDIPYILCWQPEFGLHEQVDLVIFQRIIWFLLKQKIMNNSGPFPYRFI